jgi:hypothetical protein
MKLEIYRNLWGTMGPRRDVTAGLEEAGYSGIEQKFLANIVAIA